MKARNFIKKRIKLKVPENAVYIALTKADMVNKPPHYHMSDVHEVRKCLRAWGLEKDALLWQVVKYIARWDKKHSTLRDQLEDLKKARFWLNDRITQVEEQLEKENAIRNT